MFQVLFILIFLAIPFAVREFSLITQMALGASALGTMAFVELYFIKRVEFYKILTTALLIGLFFAIIFSMRHALSIPISLPLNEEWGTVLILYISAFALYTALQVGASSIYFRKRLPLSRQADTCLVDTCAIIDGRILDISKSGFMPKSLIIPEFVVRELQLISDSHLHEKRTKGRRGLDLLKEMKNSDSLSIQISDEDYPKIKGVDNKLLHMAKQKNAKIITTDYNLFKVADVEGVKVLNINYLASLLKPVLNSGDKVKVAITKKGNNKRQGIGYLENDTMMVIEEGEKHIGSAKFVVITSFIQNDSGRIAFCKLI